VVRYLEVRQQQNRDFALWHLLGKTPKKKFLKIPWWIAVASSMPMTCQGHFILQLSQMLFGF